MIKRNQVIITALVIMVAVAGYLNYMDGTGPSEITLNDEGQVAALVPNDTLPVNSNVDDQIGIALTQEDSSFNNKPSTKKSDKSSKNSKKTGDTSSGKKKSAHVNNHISEPGEAVFVNSSIDSSYFVQAKLEREQARSKEREILDEMINNKNISENKRSECADQKIEIQKRIEKETAAESMIESKGFSEVYVRMDDETVDVVVNKETLSDAEIAQIEDIVKRKTGLSADKIRISTMKK